MSTSMTDTRVGASTGYRWYAPEPPDFWSLMRSVWDAVIGGTFSSGSNAFAWGGSMAIRRETFHAIRVPDFWRDTVSDDYALRDAVRRLAARLRARRHARPDGPHRRPGVSVLGAPPTHHPARLSPAPLVDRAGGAHLLLRWHGGGHHRLNSRQPRRRVGAPRAAFARHVERRQSRHARQGGASRVQTLVRPACLGAYAVGAAGNLDLADRAARLGIRQPDRVARQPVSLEDRSSTRRVR